MKFEFQNLGTIKKTTLDLRPLTVIVGPNNTNKTYLAYCVHGLLKATEVERRHADFAHGPADLARVATAAQSSANAAAREFTDQLAEYFQDTYGALFRETKLGVRLDDDDASGALRSTLTLPAERNAFIITYKMLSARRYRVLRDRERASRYLRSTAVSREAQARQADVLREQGDIRYPAPIEDFLDFLTDVELNAGRPLNDSRSPFGKLAQAIEHHIQAGHRTGYEPTKFGGSELALTISDRLRVDLYNASSSIKQLAPLLLYLRYKATENQTLIIDEPEMNLHPEGQAKLLEALAMLANLGVRVLLTTHSPYFMAHLNNLIASDPVSTPRKKRQAKHLYMGDQAAFLSPDDVSAYEMRPEGLVSLADPEYGIRWDTLSDVSAELQRRYFAIVEEPKARAKAR